MTRLPAVILSLICAAAATFAAPGDAVLKDSAREYLALRAALKAPTLTATQVDGSYGPWRGKTVEICGRISGRTCAGRATPTLMLQVPEAKHLVIVDLTQDEPAAEVDAVVHALMEFPATALPGDHFVLKALIREADLPAEEQIAAAGFSAASRPQVTQKLTQQITNTQAKPKSPDETPAEQPQTAPQSSQPEQPVERPGTRMPETRGIPGNTIATWKQWVGRINPRLGDFERELIVRSVIYYSALYGVDHRLSFAMIKCESDFDPGCVSHAGATGLCQLMPGTARGLGVDPWNIEQNIMGGIKYLSNQLNAYASRSNYEQFALALASYNAGPGAVKRAGGVPNIPETVRYVKKVGDLFVQLYKTMP